MLTYFKKLFARWRDAYNLARARRRSKSWVRKAVKAGVPVVEYAETEHAALTNYEEGRAIDQAFFTTPDDEAEFEQEHGHYRQSRSTIELRWECENKFGNDGFAQRADEQPLDYRARLLRMLDA